MMPTAGDTLELRPDAAELARMREFVKGQADACGLPADKSFEACLVATEAVTNAIRHGRGTGGGREPIEIRCGREPRGFFVEVGDHGRFAPPSASGEEDIGGRGLGVIKRLTHRFDLETGDAGTHLRMLLGVPECQDQTA